MAHRGRHPADDLFAAAIAGGQTVRAAAQSVGISQRTAARRAADPGFRNRIGELRSALVDAALGKLAMGMSAAADVLVALLASESSPVRLSAAKTLLETTVKIRTAIEFEDRLAILEKVTEATKESR